MFLSDQGRDAIVLKRLVTLEKLVFVGPTTSIGNVFTGPFYYYLVAPFMLITGLHPVGPAIGVALINSFGVIGISLYLWRKFDKIIGSVFLILAGFSATQIMHSRYSWNPNPAPLFTFVTLLAWHHAVTTRRLRSWAVAGILLGMSLQLHYISIVVALAMLITTVFPIMRLIDRRRHLSSNIHKHFIMPVLCFVGGAIATFMPLIVFEIKNQFINTQTLLRAFSTGEVQARNSLYIDRLKDTCEGLIRHLFLVEVNRDLAALILLSVSVIVMFLIIRERRPLGLLVSVSLTTIVINIFSLALLETGRHVHYYGPSYFPFYLIFAYLCSNAYRGIRRVFSSCEMYAQMGEYCDEASHLRHDTHLCLPCQVRRNTSTSAIERGMRASLILILTITLAKYASHQIASLDFLTDPPRTSTQISRAQQVARYIITQVDADRFQVVGLPFYETEGHYRYFLEYLGRRPMSADALGDPEELFVICHELAKPDCDIPGNPQWQIADFQNRHPDYRIGSVLKVEDVRVFKLVY